MEHHVTPEAVYEAIESFCIGFDIDGLPTYAESAGIWNDICVCATDLLGGYYQYDDPSPFKVVAATAIAIAKLAPLPEPDSDIKFAALGIESASDFSFPRLVPSIAAVRASAALLHNAEVGPFDMVTGEGRKLSNKIRFSKHTCKDLAHVLARASRSDDPQVGAIAIFFEMAAYKSNPDAEDGE